MDALTAWWQRWVLPVQCRWAGHDPGGYELVVVADYVDVVGPGLLGWEDDAGMRSLDVWIADRRDRPGAVLATVPDAPAFHCAAGSGTEGAAPGLPAGAA